jgi:hypothetical protein
MKIAIKKGDLIKQHNFEGAEYVIDLNKPFGGYEAGDLICYTVPWNEKIPLRLEIAIRTNGDLVFRSWDWSGNGNPYLHTDEIEQDDPVLKDKPYLKPFIPTKEQIDTVNGLFSGRLKFEGLTLYPGASLQKICPIDVKKEEELIGGKIFLA